ncbi:aldolase/citrate lyase family protein [Gudongella oleilytica]|uniref:aldolase/citrate lyase family protein n=1 Tax=Gudongella oleilytica TaxID=1582259 RepID=UPI000FF8AF78|nr:aldolase/citrate lyase family protein [Gudongella oleilytica]
MALKLMYITNNAYIAKIAENSGVDWIFIDLEINGKEERQGHLDTVISRHHIDDVKKIKEVLSTSELLVRVNPIFEGSKAEIDRVIDDGADIVMLPFFQSKEEVAEFSNYVGGRAKTMLLLETPEAAESIDDILSVDGIDYIHIGLNDLHLGYGMKFMFELLADGTVENLCKKIRGRGIPYGFGGIAQLGQGDLPAEYVIAEHHRIGSSMAILSRSFCNVNKIKGIEEAQEVFDRGVSEVREYEKNLKDKSKEFFEENRIITCEKIKEIKNSKKTK